MLYPLASPCLSEVERKLVLEALRENWISSKGRNVSRFEEKFAQYVGSKYAIATSSGTSALHLSLSALDIKKGDEVIVPDLTFAATINAVLYIGATPVIVDIEEESWCISPLEIKKAITSRTKAIIPVHLYGQPCNLDEIKDIASKYKIYLIEDCAEALGAEYNHHKVGSFGKIGCFSFFANKMITTGEGGMCVTNNRDLANKMMLLRDHGMSPKKKYWHDYIGYNYRMTNLQASIGLAQLTKIAWMLNRRQEIEIFYKRNLSSVPHLIPQRDKLKKRKKTTWLVSFLVNSNKINRNKLIEKLNKKGIESRPFFYPLSEMPIYKKYKKHKVSISLDISRRGINFPTNLNLGTPVYKKIINVIKSIYNIKH